MATASHSLNELTTGETALILRIQTPPELESLRQRLYEFGFIEGSAIRLSHRAPLGGDPIAVEVRGSLIAIRNEEAKYIQVEKTVT